MLDVRSVPYGDPDANRMWAATWAELGERYGPLGKPAELPPDGMIGSFVGYADGEAVGSVAVRFSTYEDWAPVAEINRLYVIPDRRGNGYSRVLMGAAEDAAWAAGATRIILETGDRQPEAVGLYERIGYTRIPNYGQYKRSSHSISFEKHLPTRVLVISGSIGTGKSTVAWAASALLTGRGVRHVVVEADALTKGSPVPVADPDTQELLFAGLRAIAPLYRDRGWGCVVIPQDVEDERDRRRYAEAFAGPAGPAQVSIVRLVTPGEIPDEDWVEDSTVEFDAVLDGVAEEVLAVVGWRRGMADGKAL